MDAFSSKLLSAGTDDIFGYCDDLGSDLPKIMLRYILLKRCCGEHAKIEPLRICLVLPRKSDTATEWIQGITGVVRVCVTGENHRIFGETVSLEDWDEPNTNSEHPQGSQLIAKYLSQRGGTKVRLFTNKKDKAAVIFVEKKTASFLYALAHSLHYILVWLHPQGDKDLDDEEKAARDLLLKNKDTDGFIKMTNEFADKYLRIFKNQKNLGDWNTILKKKTMDSKMQEVQDLEAKISSLERELNTACEQLEQQQLILSLVTNSEGCSENKALRVFNENKQLDIISRKSEYRAETITFSITETIEFYDRDAFLRMYKNPNTSFNSYPLPVRKVFYGIFGLGKGALRARSVFRLTNTASLVPVYFYPDFIPEAEAIPHPHLGRSLPCLGGNEIPMETAMRNGDVDLAIYQAIAATKNINFADLLVISATKDRINKNMDNKFIAADNGEIMSPNEFLEYLVKENNNG